MTHPISPKMSTFSGDTGEPPVSSVRRIRLLKSSSGPSPLQKHESIFDDKKVVDRSMTFEEYTILSNKIREDRSYSETNFIRPHHFRFGVSKQQIRKQVDDMRQDLFKSFSSQKPDFPKNMIDGVQSVSSRTDAFFALELREFVMNYISESIDTIIKQRNAIHRKFESANKLFATTNPIDASFSETLRSVKSTLGQVFDNMMIEITISSNFLEFMDELSPIPFDKFVSELRMNLTETSKTTIAKINSEIWNQLQKLESKSQYIQDAIASHAIATICHPLMISRNESVKLAEFYKTMITISENPDDLLEIAPHPEHMNKKFVHLVDTIAHHASPQNIKKFKNQDDVLKSLSEHQSVVTASSHLESGGEQQSVMSSSCNLEWLRKTEAHKELAIVGIRESTSTCLNDRMYVANKIVKSVKTDSDQRVNPYNAINSRVVIAAANSIKNISNRNKHSCHQDIVFHGDQAGKQEFYAARSLEITELLSGENDDTNCLVFPKFDHTGLDSKNHATSVMISGVAASVAASLGVGINSGSDLACASKLAEIFTKRSILDTDDNSIMISFLLPLMSYNRVHKDLSSSSEIGRALALETRKCPDIGLSIWRETFAQTLFIQRGLEFMNRAKIVSSLDILTSGESTRSLGDWLFNVRSNAFSAIRDNKTEFDLWYKSANDEDDEDSKRLEFEFRTLAEAKPSNVPKSLLSNVYNLGTTHLELHSERIMNAIANSVFARRLSLYFVNLIPEDIVEMYKDRIGDLYMDIVFFVIEMKSLSETFYREIRRDYIRSQSDPSFKPSHRTQSGRDAASNSLLICDLDPENLARQVRETISVARNSLSASFATVMVSKVASPEDFEWSSTSLINAFLSAFHAIRNSNYMEDMMALRNIYKNHTSMRCGEDVHRLWIATESNSTKPILNSIEEIGRLMTSITTHLTTQQDVDIIVEIALTHILQTEILKSDYEVRYHELATKKNSRITARTLASYAAVDSPREFSAWNSQWISAPMSLLEVHLSKIDNPFIEGGGEDLKPVDDSSSVAENSTFSKKGKERKGKKQSNDKMKINPAINAMFEKIINATAERLMWLRAIHVPVIGTSTRGESSVQWYIFEQDSNYLRLAKGTTEIINEVKEYIVRMYSKICEEWKHRLVNIKRKRVGLESAIVLNQLESLIQNETITTTEMICIIFETNLRKIQSDVSCSSIMNALRISNLLFVPNFDELENTNIETFAFENGVVDLSGPSGSIQFRRGKIEDYITKSTRINLPIGGAIQPVRTPKQMMSPQGLKTPLFNSDEKYHDQHPKVIELDEYLSQVFVNEDLKLYMLVSLARLFYGRNKRKKFPIWTGKGDNSKSILQSIIKNGFGDYGVDVPAESFAEDKFKTGSAASPDILQTVGTRVAFLNEPSATRPFSAATIKKYSSDTDTIFIRGLYQNGRGKVQISCTFIVCANDIPPISGMDDAANNRMEILPFLSKFKRIGAPTDPEEQRKTLVFPMDEDLPKRIPGLSRTMMWKLYHIYAEYANVQIPVPKVVQDHISEYLRRENPYFNFIEDRLELVPTSSCILSVMDAFRSFTDWMRENNPDRKNSIITKPVFVRNMESVSNLGPRSAPDQSGWVGVKFKDATPAETIDDPVTAAFLASLPPNE